MWLVYTCVGLGALMLIVYGIARLLSFKRDSNESEKRKEEVSAKYSTEMNRYAAGKERKAASARSELMRQLNEERSLIDENEEREGRLVVEAQSRLTQLASLRTQTKEHQLRERLIDLAVAQGFDVDTYLKQRLNDLDVEKLERETMVKLKGGFIYQLQDYQKLTMLRSSLDELYEREHLIESGNEPDSVKEKKLIQVRADILTLEKDANGRRQGLLQAYSGEDAGRSDTDSEP